MIQASVKLSIYWENNQVGKHQDILCFQYCYKMLSSHFKKLMNPIKLILTTNSKSKVYLFQKNGLFHTYLLHTLTIKDERPSKEIYNFFKLMIWKTY